MITHSAKETRQQKEQWGGGSMGLGIIRGSSLNRGVRNFLPVLVFYCSNQSSRQGLCLCKQFFEISENEKHF